MPRNKPPRTAHKGLWQQPTVLNNVETFANIPIIFQKGPEWFRSIGTEKSPGTKVFALGGNGCVSTTPATVTIEVVPAITSTLADVYACAGDPATLDAGAGPGYTYNWSTGETTQTITTSVPGSYSVTISNGTCSKLFTAQIINPDLPQFTNVVFDNSNNSLTITATNPAGGV